MSPAGNNPPGEVPFEIPRLDEGHVFRLLIATDDGFDPIVRAATTIQRAAEIDWPQLVLFGAEHTFPFRPRPSTILVPGMPAGVIACVPQLDEFGVASRLASPAGLPGCFDGPVTELAEIWLSTLRPQATTQIHISVSGATETIESVQGLARRLALPVSVIPA